MKWLIELTRINLQNLLKEKITKTPLVSTNKNEKQLGGIPVKNTVKRLSLVKSRSKSVSKQQSQSALVKISTIQNSPTNSPTIKPQDHSIDQTIKFINLKPLRSREFVEHLENSEEEKVNLLNSEEPTESEDNNHNNIRYLMAR